MHVDCMTHIMQGTTKLRRYNKLHHRYLKSEHRRLNKGSIGFSKNAIGIYENACFNTKYFTNEEPFNNQNSSDLIWII